MWSVRDRYSGERLALKLLAENAHEGQASSLVREATALSGLEGLGVPRVLRFGKLAGTTRLYLLRELVDGESLQHLVETAPADQCLAALAKAADRLTRLHRADLLHGDIKPANIIVSDAGDAHLVDLGLAEPFRDEGAAAHGSTPRYAAPELLAGGPLTVRAEIHALGATLGEILDASARREELSRGQQAQLQSVRERACAPDPLERYPSADEFASALRGALGVRTASVAPIGNAPWPIAGIESTSRRLLEAALDMVPGQALCVEGPRGSGRSVLLRRLSWSLELEGHALAWIDDSLVERSEAVDGELDAVASEPGAFVVVDDAHQLGKASKERLQRMLRGGARLIATTGELAEDCQRFEVPPLDRHTGARLVEIAVPSLPPRVVERLLTVSQRRPGQLRQLVALIATASIVSEDDLEALIADAPRDQPDNWDHLGLVEQQLDRGRFLEAQRLLEGLESDSPVRLAIARARLHMGLGEGPQAVTLLESVEPAAQALKDEDLRRELQFWLGRVESGVLGQHEKALGRLEPLLSLPTQLGAQALAYHSLVIFRLGRSKQALEQLARVVELTHELHSPRIEGLAHLHAGIIHFAARASEKAEAAFEAALEAAQRASDASTLAHSYSNLGVLARTRGDAARAIKCYEAAIDAGRRSGLLRTVRLSLANLANMDLFLGRLERAQASIEELSSQREHLSSALRAQLAGLEADLKHGLGQTSEAIAAYERCAEAYRALGEHDAAAEALLTGVLLQDGSTQEEISRLERAVQSTYDKLGGSPRNLPLLHMAEAHVARLSGEDSVARKKLGESLEVARKNQQPEWVWRALETRAHLEEQCGQWLTAQRDREEALLVLEDIAATLPRDLREVYWNDPKRHALQESLRAQRAPADPLAMTLTTGGSASTSSLHGRTPTESKLERILGINRELLGEFDLEKLTQRVIAGALEMLDAERGYVLLSESGGALSVHTSRDNRGDAAGAEFSRSIARRVLANQKPVVSLDAQRDSSMGSYASVHQLMLQAVACVPINGRGGEAIGALYLETRLRPGTAFERELPIAQAFADQVGLAITTARLVNENIQRANELSETNQQLEAAQARLKELLGERTQKLKVARQRLRDARDTLYGHFGYQGLVGTSSAMRRVYSLIDRVKDTDVPVLISGESGTGKEGASRAVHQASDRKSQPFLGLNCGAVPEHLLETELFGHMRGAFTGADRSRKGLIREAGRGTLLLDEIGEMPQKMQASMLRVLQERKVRPVGGTEEEPVECRFLFATHRNLKQMVEQGSFREDLYYRIVVVEIAIPPLREHTEDITLLVDHFLGLFAARYKRDRKTITKAALKRLASFHWPGNVRQLEHVLLNAWVLSDQPEIDADDLELPDNSRGGGKPAPVVLPELIALPASGATLERSREPTASSLSSHMKDEKSRITEALAACNWNRVKAAEMLGMPRRTFYRRLKQYEIQ